MRALIRQSLDEIRQRLRKVSETPQLDAQVLVAHVLGKSHTWTLAHPDDRLETAEQEELDRAVRRLENGEALPYVLGHWEFYGLDFLLSTDVLIPRPETELLVESAIKWLKLHPRARRAVDVGTGSGCIGIAIAINIPDVQMLLTDISPEALEIATQNAQRYNLCERLEFQSSDLLENISGNFDLICANLPYIPSLDLEKLDVSKREPRLALDGGESGRRLIDKLLEQSLGHLAPGGLLLMEIEASQGNKVKTYAQGLYPASRIEVHKDLAGLDRCLQVERSKMIVHLCTPAEWLHANDQGIFMDQSLETAGFIHCSLPEQILQVANRFYRGIPDLVLLWIDPEVIKAEIRWELADGAIFPHIYGPIDLEAVRGTTQLIPDADGTFRELKLPD